MCKRKQPKQGGSNKEKKTNSKGPLKNNMHNLARYFPPQTEIWWVWTVLWLPSGTNHRGKTFVHVGFSPGSFLGISECQMVWSRKWEGLCEKQSWEWPDRLAAVAQVLFGKQGLQNMPDCFVAARRFWSKNGTIRASTVGLDTYQAWTE